MKNRAIERYYDIEIKNGHYGAHTLTCKELWGKEWHSKKSYLTKWLKEVSQVRLWVAQGQKSMRRQRMNTQQRGGMYPEEEDELYRRLYTHRVEFGYPINHFWLQSEFRAILAESAPKNYASFKFSWGWAVKFCLRYRLTTQSANNIKAHDQVDRQDLIRAFHQYWLMDVQTSAPQTCPKYGRFGKTHVLHVDQVPLPFASARKRTIHMKNFGSCRIAGPNTSGLEKRQATLQLWICAHAGRQFIKPTIIFRGSRSKKSTLPKQAEKAVYDALPNIRVAFQKNAWADEEFCQADILAVAADLEAAGIKGEVCIGMDNHSSQRTPLMMDVYEKLRLVPLFTAANCTDCISPVDHHIGSYMQKHMGAGYRTEVLNNPAIWIATSEEQEIEDANCKSAMHRRMLMARWMSEAWDSLVTDHSDMIEKAFVSTGFLLAKDGSEDHLLKLQGWTDQDPYRFRTSEGVRIEPPALSG